MTLSKKLPDWNLRNYTSFLLPHSSSILPPSSFFFWASYGSEFLKNTIIFQLFFINSFFSYQFIQCLWTVHSRKNPCFCTKNCIVIRVFVDYTRENIIFLKRFGYKNCLVVRIFLAIRSVKTSCFERFRLLKTA